jgi:hypothetical protein
MGASLIGGIGTNPDSACFPPLIAGVWPRQSRRIVPSRHSLGVRPKRLRNARAK